MSIFTISSITHLVGKKLRDYNKLLKEYLKNEEYLMFVIYFQILHIIIIKCEDYEKLDLRLIIVGQLIVYGQLVPYCVYILNKQNKYG